MLIRDKTRKAAGNDEVRSDHSQRHYPETDNCIQRDTEICPFMNIKDYNTPFRGVRKVKRN